MRCHFIAGLFGILGLSVAPGPASAQPATLSGLRWCGTNPAPENYFRSSSSTMQFKALPSSFPAGSAGLARLKNAASGWSSSVGSTISLSVVNDNDNHFNVTNTESEIAFLQNAGGPLAFVLYKFSSTPSCAPLSPPCCSGSTPTKALEADIAIFLDDGASPATTFAWNDQVPTTITNSGTGFTTFPLYLQVTAQHEMGHAFGIIDHIAAVARMSPGDPNGDWFHSTTGDHERVDPMAIDERSAATLFPISSSGPHLYANNMMLRTGGGAGVINTTQALSVRWDNVGPIYPFRTAGQISGWTNNTARVGDSITWQWCGGNKGVADATSITVQFWLSTNTTLNTSSDTSIGTQTVNMPNRSSSCSVTTGIVPSVPTGSPYWLIFRIGSGGGDGRSIAVADRPVLVIP